MRLKHINTTIIILVWITLLTGLIYLANIGKIQTTADSQLITSGLLCLNDKCADTTNIDLPFFVPMRFDTKQTPIKLRFKFNSEKTVSQAQAIYLPKVSDNVIITLNGATIRNHPETSRAWNQPILTQLSTNSLLFRNNQIELVISGPPQEGIELFPFHIGSLAQLAGMHQTRTTIGIGAARFSLGLMAVLFIVIGCVWLARKNEPAYLWLSLSCLSACVYLSHYSFSITYFPYKYWTIAWAISIYVYVFFIMKFIGRFLNLPVLKLEKFCLWLIVGSGVILLAAPEQYVFLLVLILCIGTAFSALGVLVVLWLNRKNTNSLDFTIFFIVLSFALTIGVYEVVLNIFNEPQRSLHILQYSPLSMAVVCLWLIMSKLIRSLSEFEKLTQSLNETIALKSKELAEAEKHKAIAKERQRIMLDLHDGVGGQLVNSLAYMENKNVGDETLRSALEDALTDLALMLDAFENDDSITAQLGMLRTRLEALLAENGLEFSWKISEEPVLPDSGPSQNLHLARIVQEAITNVIKHADASVITVTSTASSLKISDNGKGFDPTGQPEIGSSHGIVGMRKRAKQIGADLEILSNEEKTVGTTVQLSFKKAH